MNTIEQGAEQQSADVHAAAGNCVVVCPATACIASLPTALHFRVALARPSTFLVEEAVRPGYLGAALAWRGLAGFGAGAIAPLGFGLVLDMTTTAGAGPAVSWGLGFATLGLGGMTALLCALALRRF